MQGLDRGGDASSTRTSCTVRVSRIPYAAVAEELVDFLNTSIGPNTVFACKIHTEKLNWKSKGFGFVQFETEAAAIKAVELAGKCQLRFQQGVLVMQFEHKHILDRPQIRVQCRSLYMGCLVNTNVFCELWSSEREVTIDLDCIKGKLALSLDSAITGTKYKLTWKLTSLQISGSQKNTEKQKDEFLLLQTKHAPKIRHKVVENKRKRGKEFIADRYTFFRENPEDQEDPWCRCTDFTDNQCIGQSSAYYLGIHAAEQNLYQNLIDRLWSVQAFQYTENISVETGCLYSSPRGLVPLMECSDLHKLPFHVIFQINNLVQQGILSGPSLGSACFNMLDPSVTPLPYTEMVLKKLSDEKKACYNLVEWFQSQAEPQQDGCSTNFLNRKLDEGLIRVYRLTITPTKVYCLGPELEVSNRVIRHHMDSMEDFIRVHFTDEDMGALSSRALTTSSNKLSKIQVKSQNTEVYYRICRILKEGIELGGKKFEFLAFSASQLREHSVWMFASGRIATADSIRAWMGDFMRIKNVANCAARMGQCFSASKRGPDVNGYEIEEIPDIERKVGGVKYCFSDGIGKISPNFSVEVAAKCGYKILRRKAPSAFQIRYGGYKGVVAIDPTSSHKLSLRPSMKKFQSKLVSLDILEWTRFLPCYLNRQIITLLSTLGIEDNIFEEMQKERMTLIDGVLTNKDVALEMIQVSCGGEYHKILVEMLMAGYHPGCEPFLSSMLQAFKAAQIQEICKKSKIFVPKGRVLMGCLDETANLEYGEVFMKISVSNATHDTDLVVQGKVVVAKNPCLHPGDVRVLHAVDSPNLQHMVDCIVFPQNGSRPHPNECSGSDLDGDLYFVTWDVRLIPPETDMPMDYYPPNPVSLDHSPTLEEIQTYFVDYMSNDSLGTIANAHVVFADKEPEKARSWQCKELAELSSIAVDFPKTGVPAILPKYLRPQSYPDFMEKNGKNGKKSYKSSGVLGKLYRAAKEAASVDLETRCARDFCEFYDEDLVVKGLEDHVRKALVYKKLYNEKLTALMEFYGVQSEAEMLTGFFCQLRPTLNNSSKGVQDRIQEAVVALKREARSWFDGMDNDAGHSHANEEYARASAWYHVTYHPEFVGENGDVKVRLLSFPWVVYDMLLRVKRFNRLVVKDS